MTLKPCSSHECKNGKCIAQSGQYSCQCFKGFSGSYCDVDIDECLISPCFAGVDCINSVGSYSCGPCPVGYTGDGLRCEKLMDPCEMLNCLNGTCIAQGGQYFCQCLQGFSGKRCDIDINECLDSPCFVGVYCTNYPGSYSCGPCPVGFTGDGSHCEKILHPCEKLNCFKDVPCVYKRQKYECGNCPPRFTGNGAQCTGKSGFFLQIRENSQRQIAFRVSNIAERTELAGFLMAGYLFFGQQQRDKSKKVP